MTEHAISTTAFIERWSNANGTERTNYQLFVSKLGMLPASRGDLNGE